MRWLIAAVGLLLSVPALAVNVKDIEAYTNALVDNMALNWVCRETIGIAHYQAARTIARDSLARYLGETEAVLFVDKIDEKFRNDPRRYPTKSAWCYEMKSDLVHKINVEKAKLETE